MNNEICKSSDNIDENLKNEQIVININVNKLL